jgi:hypothetical protein
MLYPVQWVQSTGKDPDTRIESYGATINIKVYRYGSMRFIRDSQSGTQVSAQKYITVDEVKLGDKLNGQVVKQVDPIPDFSGGCSVCEVLCW